MSDPKINASTPIGKIYNDRFTRHLNHLNGDTESNFDSYFACFIDGVNDVSSNNDSDSFSSHDESVLDSGVRSGFKVYTNALYDEDPNDDQLMFCQDVQQGSLHGVINPLFEEHMELLDLVENDLNTDTLSYFYKRLGASSSECDGKTIDEIAFHD